MELRPGAQRGPARVIDYVGMFFGVLAPLTLAGFVILRGESARGMPDGYSHVSDPITDLGASGRFPRDFIGVNLAVAVFLFLFAFVVYRRLPVGRFVALGFVAGAVNSVFVGLTAVGLSAAHGFAVMAALLLTVLLPYGAAQNLPRTERYAWLRRASGLATKVGVVLIVLFLLAVAYRSEEGGVLGWLDGSLPSAVPDLPYKGGVFGLLERLVFLSGYGWMVAVDVFLFLGRGGDKRRQVLDIGDVQENILYGSRQSNVGWLCFLEITDSALFRSGLARALADGLIQGELQRPRPATRSRRDFSVTIGLSRRGVDKLLPHEYCWRAANEDAFGEGMEHRAEKILGDDIEKWDDGYKAKRIDAVVWVTAENDAALRRTQLAARKVLLGSKEVHREATSRLGADPSIALEHFGFVDGVSQPWIAGVHPAVDPNREGGGKLVAGGRFEPLAIGEFLLGYVDEGNEVFPVPDPYWLFAGGTFLVVRKLQQDVAAFRRECDRLQAIAEPERNVAVGQNGAARKSKLAERASFAELLVGRYRDGTPLGTVDRTQPPYRSAKRAISTSSALGAIDNRIIYRDDPEGFGCPLGAHIRRANPRDALGFDGVPAHRRRIIRRGMPYGRPLAPDAREDDEVERGIMFLALNARIADQFEFIQQRWLNDGDAFRLGRNPDLIAGYWSDDNSRQLVLQDARSPLQATIKHPLVTPRGGEYFFLPTISALRRLSG